VQYHPLIRTKGDTVEHGHWFYRTGKNHEEPNGQIKMLAPTEELMQLFKINKANRLLVDGFIEPIGEIGNR
jgi:hypothetical protein